MTAFSCLLVVVIGITNCVNSLQGLKDDKKHSILMTVAADFTNGQISIKRNFAPENIITRDGQSRLSKKRYPTQEELMNLTTSQSRTHMFIPKISSSNGLEIQVMKIKPSEPKSTNLSTSELENVTTVLQSTQIKLNTPPDIIETTGKTEVENSKGSREEEKTKRELEDTTNIILGGNKKDSDDFKNGKDGDNLELENSEKKINVDLNKSVIKNSTDLLRVDTNTSKFEEENKTIRNLNISNQNTEDDVFEKSKVNLTNIDVFESENNKINESKSIWKKNRKFSNPEHKASHNGDNPNGGQENSKGKNRIMNKNPVIIQTAREAKPLEEILRKNKRISDEKKEEEDWKLLKELKESKIKDTEIDVEYRKERDEKNPTKVYEPCKGFSFVLLERCPDIKKDPNAYNCRTVYVKNVENECTYFVCAPVQNRHFGAGSHMEPQLMYCPPGTYFSTHLLVCDYMDNASHEICCPSPEKANNSTTSIA